jgi:hypothetical protein
MTTGREWLSDLFEDVRLKNERVKKLRDNGEKAVDELRTAVQKDVEFINREIYLHEDALEIFADALLSFRVSNDNTEEEVHVELRPEDEALVLDIPHRREQYFFAESDNSGGVYFKDEGRPISVEAISQRIIEPLVKAEFGLD